MRKEYAKPAVVTEEYLEQTSLACNLTETPPLGFGGYCDEWFPPDTVWQDFRKGGAWMEDYVNCSAGEYVYASGEGCGPAGWGGGVLLS